MDGNVWESGSLFIVLEIWEKSVKESSGVLHYIIQRVMKSPVLNDVSDSSLLCHMVLLVLHFIKVHVAI